MIRRNYFLIKFLPSCHILVHDREERSPESSTNGELVSVMQGGIFYLSSHFYLKVKISCLLIMV